jgi:hypothetical protein
MGNFKLPVSDHILKNRVLLALLMVSMVGSYGFGQALSLEEVQFQFEGGTALPCPVTEVLSTIRPDPPGKATRVGVGMVFLQIFEIDASMPGKPSWH